MALSSVGSGSLRATQTVGLVNIEMNLANRDVGKLASVLIGGTVDQQRISLRTLLLCNLLVLEIHLNTTNLPSGRKTVSGAYLGMTLSCCGATLAHAIGMVFPAFISVKISWKNRPNPSPLRSIVK